jgi:5-methylcytosine-specific restriction endonuclease McrA
VPLYMGGADEVSNMVLMCGECHDAQPDSVNPEDTYAFMRE